MNTTENVVNQYFKDNDMRMAENTIIGNGVSFKQFFGYCQKELKEIKASDIRAWLLNLAESGLKPSSIKERLSNLKGIFKYCQEEGIIETNPTLNVALPKVEDSLPVYLEKEELNKLREAAKGDPRRRAIIETLYATGVRLSELLNIKLSDIDWENRQILITGKRDKERIVLFTIACAERLKEYLTTRTDQLPNLFLDTKGKPLEVRYVQYYFEQYSKKLGVKVTPHTLRHTFAAHLAMKGMPLACIQTLLGHDEVEQTKVYARLFAKTRNAQYNKFS